MIPEVTVTEYPECSPLEDNAFGLAGTSINPQNQDGWATIAANLAPYLSNYVKINFVLFHTDAPGNTAQFPTLVGISMM